MSAVFTVEDIAVLHGVSYKTARGMFTDRTINGEPGPYRRLPGRRVITGVGPVLDALGITRTEALTILDQQEQAA